MTDIELVAYEVAGGLGKDHDVPFRKRLENSVVQLRATIFKQQFDRDGRFPTGSEDTITVPMIAVPATECLDEEIKCEVYRTEAKIPRPIRRNRTAVPFIFVGLVNQEISFIYTKPEEVRSIIEGTRFIKQKSLYAYYNDYVYTFNYSGGKITIRDVFSDPRELLTLQGCDKKPCKVVIDIDEDMKRQIKMMIFEEIRQFNRLPEDQTVRINEGV